MIFSGFTLKGDNTSRGFSGVIGAVEEEGEANFWDRRADFLFSGGDEGIGVPGVIEWLVAPSALLLSLLSGILPGLSALRDIRESAAGILSSCKGVASAAFSRLLASLSFTGVCLPRSGLLWVVASLLIAPGPSGREGTSLAAFGVSASSNSFAIPEDLSFCLAGTLQSPPMLLCFSLSAPASTESTLPSLIDCRSGVCWDSEGSIEVEVDDRGSGGAEMGRGDGLVGRRGIGSVEVGGRDVVGPSETEDVMAIDWGGETAAPAFFDLADLSGRLNSWVLGESVCSGTGVKGGAGGDSDTRTDRKSVV